MFKKSMILAGLLFTATNGAELPTTAEGQNTATVSEVVDQTSTQKVPTWTPRRCGKLPPASTQTVNHQSQPESSSDSKTDTASSPRRMGKLKY